MKRKTAVHDPVVPKELLDQARKAVQADRLPRRAACVVCGSECAPNSTEDLCWVCRRLKISAWRDTELQMPAQE